MSKNTFYSQPNMFLSLTRRDPSVLIEVAWVR